MKILKYILCILLIILFIIIITNLYVIFTAKKRILDDFNNVKVDAIIVLGSSIVDDKPGVILKDRLDKAIELYKSGVSSKIIMSGDSTRSDHDEAGVMMNYAIENGVNKEDIIIDYAGLSTYDTMYRTKNVFNIKSAVVVTQKYHLYRSVYVANSLGIKTYGAVAISDAHKGDTKRRTREILARSKDMFKCIIKPQSKYIDIK